MATNKITLKHLHVIRSKGRTYYYAWRGGPRMTAEFGTPEFYAEFLAARTPNTDVNKTTFAAWVCEYRMSDKWKNLAAKSKIYWSPFLDSAQEHFGSLPVRLFDRKEIRKDIKVWRDQWKDRPRAADSAKQVLSNVLALAVDDGKLTLNPCAGIAGIYTGASRAEIIWPQADMDAVEVAGKPEIVRAMKLAALTGLRRIDLLELTWAKVSDLTIETRTKKSRYKKLAVIPIYRALRELLATIPKRGPFVLTNASGRPWTVKGFESVWQDAKKKAGLGDRDLHFHDLRGTAATFLYRTGMSSQEIADILGWESGKDGIEKLINTYVKKDELIRDRVRRMDRHENETSTKTVKLAVKPGG